jgi:hypothetical protein
MNSSLNNTEILVHVYNVEFKGETTDFKTSRLHETSTARTSNF